MDGFKVLSEGALVMAEREAFICWQNTGELALLLENTLWYQGTQLYHGHLWSY